MRHNKRFYTNPRFRSLGPQQIISGTAKFIVSKYDELRDEAIAQNDLILAEKYNQYADHYLRLQ